VQVVDHDQQGRLLGQRAEQVGDRGRDRLHVQLLGLRRGRCATGAARAVAGFEVPGGAGFAVPHEGQQQVGGEPRGVRRDAGQPRAEAAQPLLGGGAGGRRRGVGEADRDPYQIGQGRQPPRVAERGAVHAEHAGLPGTDVVPGDEALGLGREAGLAQAGLAGDHHDPGLAPVGDLGEPAGHPGQLGVPPDERRLVAQARPGARGVQQPEQLVRLDRFALALQPQRPQPPPGGDVPAARRGALARVDGADGGRVGQPGRGVHRVADDRVLQSGLYPRDHLAGVEPDAQPERGAAAALVVQHPAYRPLHRQGGPHRALGVVLVRDRRAEHGHDPVAGQLVHVPAEGLDRTGKGGQDAVGHRAHPLRVVHLRPRREVGQVAEQHGHHPPLGRGQGGGGRQRGTAVVAEPCAGNGHGSTHGTGHGVSNHTVPGSDSLAMSASCARTDISAANRRDRSTSA
jgi:hypothetical protein